MEKDWEEVAYLRSKLTINGIGALATEHGLALLKSAQSYASKAEKEADLYISRYFTLVVFAIPFIGSLLALFAGERLVGAFGVKYARTLLKFCGTALTVHFVRWYLHKAPEFGDCKLNPGTLPDGLSEESREVFERLKVFVENADLNDDER